MALSVMEEASTLAAKLGALDGQVALQDGCITLAQLAQAVGGLPSDFQAARAEALARGWTLLLKLPLAPSEAAPKPAEDPTQGYLLAAGRAQDALALGYQRRAKAWRQTESWGAWTSQRPWCPMLPGPNPDADEELALLRWARGQGEAPGVHGAQALAAHGQGLLVQAYLRLACEQVLKAHGRGVDLDDLLQEALLGMLHAAKLFKPELGHRFSTYATPWVRQHIDRHLKDHGRTVRVPVHMHERSHAVAKRFRELGAQLGREATDEEVGEALGLKPDEVRLAIAHLQSSVSLDAPTQDEGQPLGASLPAPERSLEDEVDLLMLGECLLGEFNNLKFAHHGGILVGRYGLGHDAPHTLESLGDRLGITRERVRQIQAKAERRLAQSPQIQAWAVALGHLPEAVVNAPQVATKATRRQPSIHHRPRPAAPDGPRDLLGWRPGSGEANSAMAGGGVHAPPLQTQAPNPIPTPPVPAAPAPRAPNWLQATWKGFLKRLPWRP